MLFMSQGGEDANVRMARHLRSHGGPASDHVPVEWTQMRTTAGTSCGLGACVSSTSSSVAGGLHSTVATVFGWASGSFGSPVAGHGQDDAEAESSFSG